MGVPSTRTPVQLARGTHSNLTTANALAALQEGEIAFATDQSKLYVKQGSVLKSVSGAMGFAAPTPSDISATPAFDSGTGTQADPFIITPAQVSLAGSSATSSQKITITGLTPGDLVIFEDDSTTASGDRFKFQPTGTIDSGGQFSLNLQYSDVPTTTLNFLTYNGVLRIGTAYFSWSVVQSNLPALAQATATTIAGPTSGQMVATNGTVTGGTSPYSTTVRWQRSFDGTNNWFDITGATSATYVLTEADYGYYVRAVTTFTDSTNSVAGGPFTIELSSASSNKIDEQGLDLVLVSSSSTTYNASVNSRLILQTSSNALTITLPASPAQGDWIDFTDGTSSFSTNNLTLDRNSLKIMGLAENMVVDNDNATFRLVYVDATNGWRIN